MTELEQRLQDCREGGGIALNLSYLDITDLNCVLEFPNLQELEASYTQVNDLTPLMDLNKLKYLYLVNTPVTDLSVCAPLITENGLELYR